VNRVDLAAWHLISHIGVWGSELCLLCPSRPLGLFGGKARPDGPLFGRLGGLRIAGKPCGLLRRFLGHQSFLPLDLEIPVWENLALIEFGNGGRWAANLAGRPVRCRVLARACLVFLSLLSHVRAGRALGDGLRKLWGREGPMGLG